MSKAVVILTTLALLFSGVGCSKKQIIPGILAGSGAALMVGGIAYRVSLPEEDNEGAFGRQPEQKAGVAVMLFAGAALILTGIIWSATTPVCDSDLDCWSGDVCQKSTMTCVPKPATQPASPGDDGPVSLMADPLMRPTALVPDRFTLRIEPFRSISL